MCYNQLEVKRRVCGHAVSSLIDIATQERSSSLGGRGTEG